jgi:HD-GYP domain-containing protein (c-di-GMP phosphodiesterase class II)
VAAVAGQVHEREDGSGYPRGRTSGGIHPLAKIVAVADSFCAMTRARPHRAGMPRHAAMRTLLGEGHAGRLDRGALRGLLDAVSAYPIGCVVELSDARKAQVLRPNRGAHTRPVLRVLGADNAPTNELIDLAADRSTTVASISDPGWGA